MKTTIINNKTYTVAESWNELTGRQTVAMVGILETKCHPDSMALACLRVLTGMSWYQYFMTPTDELVDRFDLLEFIFAGDGPTKNPLPTIHGYHGPADDFGNLLMDEFVHADDAFMRWTSNQDEEALNELCAILYRRKKKGYDLRKNPDGDARVSFSHNESLFFADIVMCNWLPATRQTVAAWYGACRQKLQADFPDVFSSDGGEPAKYGMVALMMNVAETGVLGDFSKVEKQYVRLVMVSIDEQLTRAKNIEKEMNNGN